MKDSSTGGDQGGSSSNPTPNPNPNPPTNPEESPRRRTGGPNAPPPSPQGRGAPSSAPQTSRELALTPPQWRPVMGVPGQSAFTPYTRPSHPHWPAPGSSSRPSGSGLGFAGGLGFQGAHAVPVGGSVYGGVGAAGALRIGGNPAARKRVREGGAGGAAGAAGGNQQGEGGGNAVNCSVCGKAFMSPKALFGHMRSHPDRGWKGAHPPPAFRAEDEFADLQGLNQSEPAAAAAGEAEEGADGAGAEHMDAEEAAEGAGEEEEEGGEPRNYRLPDLNNPPPPDAN